MMKNLKKTLLGMGLLALIAVNLGTVSDINNNGISLNELITFPTAQAEETGNKPGYYSTNPFDKSGTDVDEYGQKWCWTWKGDSCNKKGDNCPNGIVDTYKSKKC